MQLSEIKKSTIYKATVSWISNRNMSVSASLAYYSLFSLAPILVLAISIAGIFFGMEAVQGHLMFQFEGLLGRDGAGLLQDMIKSSYLSENNILALGVSIGGILIGATAVFSELSAAFRRIFNEERKYRWAWMSFIMERLYGLVLVVGIGFITITSLIASAVIAALSKFMTSFYGNTDIIITLINIFSSLVITILIFYMMFAIRTPVTLPRKVLFLGSLNTAIFFELGKHAIGLYIGHSSTASVFGAAGTLAILLIWLNYAAMIILFGIELTNVLYLESQPADRRETHKNIETKQDDA